MRRYHLNSLKSAGYMQPFFFLRSVKRGGFLYSVLKIVFGRLWRLKATLTLSVQAAKRKPAVH